ncbi:hypothetical protein ACFL6B_03415 [Thermodesulfobacteriota bacterium]
MNATLKNLVIIIILSLSFSVLSCAVTRYTVKGNVAIPQFAKIALKQSTPLDPGKITTTKIRIKCPRDIPLSKSTSVDINGFYQLEGAGVPEGCTLVIENPNFLHKEITIEDVHLKNNERPGSYVYEVNVKLID